MSLNAFLPFDGSCSLLELVCYLRKHYGSTSRSEEAIRCLTDRLLHRANRWSPLRDNLSGYDYEQVALDSVHVLLTRYVFDSSVAFQRDAAIFCLLKKIVTRRKVSEIRRISSRDAKNLTNACVFSNGHFTDLSNPASLCEHHEEFSHYVNRLQTDAQRRVFELRYTGYTVKEIAQKLELTVNRVRAIRYEIRRLLSTNHQSPTINHRCLS